MDRIAELENIASQVRRDIVRMVNACSSGHPGGSLGCADLMTALYFEILDCQPQNFTMEGRGEDMFFLSNGHIAPVWYSVLARSGYFPIKDLSTLRQLGSPLQGHPTPKYNLPGVRVASGSLGQGLSVGIGAALAKKMDGCGHLVYTLHGDGELQEGQIWEAIMFAGGNKVDNLISIIDVNNAQIDGKVEDVLPIGNLKAKFLAFDWEVLEMNGNDMENCVRILNEAKKLTKKGKPVAILMNTLMGYGVDFMQGSYKWHGVAPSNEQTENALSQLKETLGDY